jgi:hypothetical protein
MSDGLLAFVGFIQFAIGCAIGFSVGVSHMHRRLARDRDAVYGIPDNCEGRQCWTRSRTRSAQPEGADQ